MVVAAIRDSQGMLFSALAVDVPAYVTWATAIVIIGSIGFVPGLKPVSRGLLVLILVVLVLRNYSTVISGFNNAWQGSTGKSSASPSDAQLQNMYNTLPVGSGPGNSNTGTSDVYVSPGKSSSISSSSPVAFNSFSSAYGVI